MTESVVWKPASQRAVTALERLRLPGGVWRYGIRHDLGDASLSLWAALPLVAARRVNVDDERRGKPPTFDLDGSVPAAVEHWLTQVTDHDTGVVRQSTPGSEDPALPGSSPRAMTALAALVRLWHGESPRSAKSLQRAGALAAAAPTEDESPAAVDMFQRWAGTCATFMTGRDPWKTWEHGLETGVANSQHVEGDYCGLRGSWDPVGAWAPEGGRVVMTALMCLCLEVYYRYGHPTLVR